MRLDKWLWAARFYRTRRLATDEINKGRVLVNEQLAKPARMIAEGDVITVRKAQMIFEVTVLKLLPNRGPASIAATMYEELPQSIERRNRERELRRLAPTIRPEKPDKREKRELRRVKQGLHID